MAAHERMRAAVLGSPIGHSLSPALHRAAYAGLGLDWRYDAIDVDAAALPGFLAGLDGTWAGLSLTMPLKEAVLPLLDRADPAVTATRAANTVVPENGALVGYNTDIDGILAALAEAGLPARPQRGLIIGAGATARSAAFALGRLGCAQVTVAARRPGPAAQVAGVARAAGAGAADPVPLGPLTDLAADVVVCTLPADAGAGLAGRVPHRPGVLLDVTYHPWPTTLAAAWAAAGGTVVPGAAMLLWQAVEQVRLMTRMQPPVALMRAALVQ